MKKIEIKNIEILNIEFDGEFSDVIMTDAEVTVKINNKYTIPFNNVKVIGLDLDTFGEILVEEYGLDEDTAYSSEIFYKKEYKQYDELYQTLSKDFALEQIYQLIDESDFNKIIVELKDRDILDRYVA